MTQEYNSIPLQEEVVTNHFPAPSSPPAAANGRIRRRLRAALAGDRRCGGGERPWAEHRENPPRGVHDCLRVLGPEDVVVEYYQQQGEMLEGFYEMDALSERGFLPGMSKEEREKTAKSKKMAIRISNIAIMVYASIRSESLAIIASTSDSLLDLLSSFILWFTAFSMQTPNP